MNDQLEQKLQQMAINNWAMFIALVGQDSMITAKVQLMREDGKSWAQIAAKLKISVMQARTAGKKKSVAA